MKLSTLILAASIAAVCEAGPPPHNSWDTVPVAFHGANKTGPWTEAAVQQLAKYGMVTVEKWDGVCGSTHPVMNGPCDEETLIIGSLKRVRELNPNTILVAYQNSVIDFSFYNLHQTLAELEGNGTKVWMRDVNGKVVDIDNDGSFYWNITRFDVTQPAMLKAWQDQVEMYLATGIVQGVFADHGNKFLENSTGTYQLCDGAEPDRYTCVDFSDSFAEAWNAAHVKQMAWAQATVDPYPAFDSLNATWMVEACDFDAHLQAVEAGMWVEAKSKRCATKLDNDCLAGFLAAAGDKSFFLCLSSQDDTTPMPTWFPEFDYPLGAPDGPATQGPAGVWTRKFASGTTVQYDNNKQTGVINWSKH
jgi:hypothetical protein